MPPDPAPTPPAPASESAATRTGPETGSSSDARRALLAFAARQPLILADHAAIALGTDETSALRVLAALETAGLLRRERWSPGEEPSWRITPAGLNTIDSPLPPPTLALRDRHARGTVWLWLAARDGALGPIKRSWTEREMRADDHGSTPYADAQPRAAARVFGLTLEDPEHTIHYPDLALETRHGRRVAIELQLTAPAPYALRHELTAASRDPTLDTVLYLSQDLRTGERIVAASDQLGVSDLVRVQRVTSHPRRHQPPAHST